MTCSKATNGRTYRKCIARGSTTTPVRIRIRVRGSESGSGSDKGAGSGSDSRSDPVPVTVLPLSSLRPRKHLHNTQNTLGFGIGSDSTQFRFGSGSGQLLELIVGHTSSAVDQLPCVPYHKFTSLLKSMYLIGSSGSLHSPRRVHSPLVSQSDRPSLLFHLRQFSIRVSSVRSVRNLLSTLGQCSDRFGVEFRLGSQQEVNNT